MTLVYDSKLLKVQLHVPVSLLRCSILRSVTVFRDIFYKSKHKSQSKTIYIYKYEYIILKRDKKWVVARRDGDRRTNHYTTKPISWPRWESNPRLPRYKRIRSIPLRRRHPQKNSFLVFSEVVAHDFFLLGIFFEFSFCIMDTVLT